MAKQVLVVEDNPVNQAVIRGLLEPFDLEVSLAGNGVEALESVGANRFDVILMDLLMPLMDGLEATNKIRSLGGWCASVPIIAVTANPDLLKAPHRGLDEGFTDVLPKPIDSKTLAHVLLEHLPAD